MITPSHDHTTLSPPQIVLYSLASAALGRRLPAFLATPAYHAGRLRVRSGGWRRRVPIRGHPFAKLRFGTEFGLCPGRTALFSFRRHSCIISGY